MFIITPTNQKWKHPLAFVLAISHKHLCSWVGSWSAPEKVWNTNTLKHSFINKVHYTYIYIYIYIYIMHTHPLTNSHTHTPPPSLLLTTPTYTIQWYTYIQPDTHATHTNHPHTWRTQAPLHTHTHTCTHMIRNVTGIFTNVLSGQGGLTLFLCAQNCPLSWQAAQKNINKIISPDYNPWKSIHTHKNSNSKIQSLQNASRPS